MLLYSFTITPNNRKVEAFVRHYDLDVDIHHISFKDNEQKSSEFLAINPMGRVPALVDGDLKLWESNAILTYLAQKFPGTNALPTDLEGRADADRWLHWQNAHLMMASAALKTGEAKNHDTINELLGVLNGQLEGKDWVLGELSVVDFAIASYLITKLMQKLDYSPFPNVAAWRNRVVALAGFVATQVGPPRT